MTADLLFAFTITSMVLLLSPGPVVLFALINSFETGLQKWLPIAMGIVFGDLFAMTVSLLGLGLILSTNEHAHLFLQVVGGIVLSVIGVQTVRHSREIGQLKLTLNRAPQPLFRQSIALTATHPGSYLIFTGFFPLFIDSDVPIVTRAFILGSIYILVAFLSLSVWMATGTLLRRSNHLKPILPYLRIGGGLWLVALGLFAIFEPWISSWF